MPSAHVFEGMREVLSTGHLNVNHLWCAMILNVLYLVLAGLIFELCLKGARTRGFLAKFERNQRSGFSPEATILPNVSSKKRYLHKRAGECNIGRFALVESLLWCIRVPLIAVRNSNVHSGHSFRTVRSLVRGFDHFVG